MLRDCLGNRALSKSVIPTNSYGLLMGQDTTIAFKNCHFQGLQGKTIFEYQHIRKSSGVDG